MCINMYLCAAGLKRFCEEMAVFDRRSLLPVVEAGFLKGVTRHALELSGRKVALQVVFYSRSLLMYRRSILVYYRSLLVCGRSFLVYSRSLFVYSRSLLVYSRSLLVYRIESQEVFYSR